MQKDSARIAENEVLGADSLSDNIIGHKETKTPEGKVTNWMFLKGGRFHVRTRFRLMPRIIA